MAQTTTEPSYKTLQDGTVEITFDHKEAKAPPACFPTQYMMTAVEPDKAEVLAFQDNGSPVYAFQTATGYKYWDVCDCPDCTKTPDDEEPKKSSPGKKLKQRLAKGDKQIGLLGQPSGKFDYIVKYSPPEHQGQDLPKAT